MKTLLTTVALLILGLGSSIASVGAQKLEPGQTLPAAHYRSDSYAALSRAAGFSSTGGDAGISQLGPGFSPPPASSTAPDVPAHAWEWDSPGDRGWAGNQQYDSDSAGKGALPSPATGIGTASMPPRRNPGSAYEGRLPPTSTSSVDFDIVER